MAASEGKTILFDLPTKKAEYGCWSPNVWKTRMVLNYKSIPYKTTFLRHEELEPALSAIGMPPNPPKPEGAPGPAVSKYTVPAIQLPDGTCAMDSAKIAPKLQELHPEPNLHLGNGLHDKVAPILGSIMMPLMSIVFLRIKQDVLVPETLPTWTAKREATIGMSLEELDAIKGGKTAWENAQPGFEALRKFLIEHKKDQGPFVTGSQVSYVDFVLAGLLEGSRRIGQDIFEEFCENVPDIKPLYEACRPWLKEDR